METNMNNCWVGAFSNLFPGTSNAANFYCAHYYWTATNENTYFMYEVSGWNKANGFSRNTDGNATVLAVKLTPGRQYKWKIKQLCNSQGGGGGSKLSVNGASQITPACGPNAFE